MTDLLFQLLSGGRSTQPDLFPPLPAYSRGLPTLTESPCVGCGVCADTCPTNAIEVSMHSEGCDVTLDRGLCITCGLCTATCPTGTLAEDRETKTAVVCRDDLVLTTASPRRREAADQTSPVSRKAAPFRRSIHLRVVATGDSASDLEIAAANNPVFDASRLGIHIVASPRFADALVVTGPVPRAMHDPLRRCYEAMADPRLVVAVGVSAISGGVHRGGYAGANGADAILPVAVYIPGNPPHPWGILHGILLAMGSAAGRSRGDIHSA